MVADPGPNGLGDLVGTGVALDREAVLEVGVDVGHRSFSAP